MLTRILITGGLGSIGQNLCKSLLRQGAEITILDDGSSSIPAPMINLAEVGYVHGDIANSEKVSAVIRGLKPHFVYHLAAHFANQNSVDFPYSDLATNLTGTINVLECLKGNPELKKFVYASSSCVYGGESMEMSEEDRVYPFETPYAINKFAAELYTRFYASYHNVPSVSLRIFNTYGPGEAPGKYRNVIPNFIRLALLNEDITITGTGKETRDFTFVSDTVDLLELAANSRFREGEVFNGGTGYEVSILELAQMIIAYSGSRSEIKFASRRDWDLVARRKAVIDKAKSLLGYSPTVGIRDGLQMTIPWYKTLMAK